ncbi:MAG TPA: pullulanase-type alpha-1,6-glucosidase, partial [Herpetosiphonaceae bacterium]|nr:pullulanase-type alpha-1,6-glucosidase [Herpetosiphonaceae bacterium]
MYFGYEASSDAPASGPAGARAYWVTRDTLLWAIAVPDDYTYRLHYDLGAGIKLLPEGVTGGKQISLTRARQGPAEAVWNKFPHLRGMAALTIAADDQGQVAEALRGQIVVSAVDRDGRVVDATGLQIPGVLDDLYSYDGPLGVAFDGGAPVLRLWAPTAQSVKLRVFDDSSPPGEGTSVDMEHDARTGVWSVEGPASWKGKYYLYEVEVFVRSTGRIERNLVTDPYSLSLSTNSQRSQIVDLDDPALMPHGWQSLHKPTLDAPEDIVLYELHVRDFSITDQTVAPENRGTFRAFTEQGSNGMRHLHGLAKAGLTHIHLLPVFDIATIEEDRAARVEPDAIRLAELPPDSEEQQALIEPLRDKDGFNWGYDPYHFTVPEGSYATDPDGSARIREFREMVMALSEAGLRVVMDVVYNHTNASGQSPKSVLDRIVPGYYHRLDAQGQVETSTCCQNTASEHAMMEKLMLDSLRTWATAYKVDGFRFDLMAHHMVANMVRARDLLARLTPEKDGVDGSKIYLYGEGWNFGEVANNARGANATQPNMAG